MPTTVGGLASFHTCTASQIWSKWPWVTSIASNWSMRFSESGQAGLFCTQASISRRLPPGVSKRNVPCPYQVILVSRPILLMGLLLSCVLFWDLGDVVYHTPLKALRPAGVRARLFRFMHI